MTNSLKHRYTAKISSNIFGILFNIFAQAIIPRGLGPVAYGNFNFITGFFQQIIPILTFGSLTGFYVKLSQCPKNNSLIAFYFIFNAACLMILLLSVSVIYRFNLSALLWTNIEAKYVYMAVAYAFIFYLMEIMTKISDAFGLTISTEFARIIIKLLGLSALGLLLFWNYLYIDSLFVFHYFSLSAMVCVFWVIIFRTSKFGKELFCIDVSSIKRIGKDLYKYSQPLFIITCLGMLTLIIDRWLLQQFGGSVEQGLFGLAFQVGSVCLIFTSAITSLIMREFAISYANNKDYEILQLFDNYIFMLYGLAAYLGCFISSQSEIVVTLFGGKQFESAKLPLTILALYPIHQTYGQLGGAIFYATSRTRILRTILLIMFPLSITASYILMAPKEYYGIDLGAVGLAIKFVVFQFVVVNIQLYINTRMLKVKMSKYIFSQITILVAFIIAAYSSKYLINYLFVSSNIVVKIILSGMLYTGLAIILALLFPKALGINKIFDTLIYLLKKVYKNKKQTP